jgi:hypothetical protein
MAGVGVAVGTGTAVPAASSARQPAKPNNPIKVKSQLLNRINNSR